MNVERNQAANYLRAPFKACWSWAENGAVLVWRDGTTVAFREEVIAVLERLAGQNLPAFSAIALLLAACRGKVPEVADVIGKTSEPARWENAGVLKSARQQLALQVESTLDELRKLRELPADLLTGLNAKSFLAEIVFESARLERQTDPNEILQGLKGPFSDAELNSTDGDSWTVSQVGHLFMIARGLKPHSAETLRLRLLTGLDLLPGAAEIEVSPADQARKLLQDLLRDEEHAGLARAARDLMAAIRLPRHLAEPEELAIGGVSDISNRGPLDRLLLSELAHDDLTLATRVALNEALYLRREPPAREPPSTLALLLDSGVRLWGLPRLFATAVALALVARERRHGQISVWRAHEHDVRAVDLLTRRGLVSHLAELEADYNPAEALVAFAQKCAGDFGQGGSRDENSTDSVLITHRDTIQDPDFRRCLSDHPQNIRFIAAVDRTGRFELHATPLAHRPPLCEATLDLESLFKERSPATPLNDKAKDPGFPLIFNVRPFPLLLPVHGKIESYWPNASGDGGVCVMKDRRLLKWKNSEQGSQQIAAGIPWGGQTLWLEEIAEGKVNLVRLWGKKRILLIQSDQNAPACDCRDLDLRNCAPVAFHQAHNFLYIIGFSSTEVCDLRSGEIAGRGSTPSGMTHRSGCFFTHPSGWFFVTWNGQGVVWEQVTFPKQLLANDVVLIFSRHGYDIPMALTRWGDVFDLEGQIIFRCGQGILWAKASRDGQRLLVNSPNPGEARLLHLAEKRIETIRAAAASSAIVFNSSGARIPVSAAERDAALDPKPPAGTRQLRNRFKAVEVRHPNVITLHAAEGTGLIIAVDSKGSLQIRNKAKYLFRPATAVEFRPLAAPADLGCQLQLAQWPGGSRAFLDSRGLIHLKSHDPTIAEVTLVLHEGEAAGWSSDGLLGKDNFFAPRGTGGSHDLAERVTAFVDRVC
jgi:hypothetical protein